MKSLPCQANPQRWFDRRRHASARTECRRCPARQWCAREALQCRATDGTWAGVWIGGRHEDAAAHLQAVADGTLARSAAATTALLDPGERHSPAAAPLRPPTARPATSTKAAVLARSSGHCEVMAGGCRYSYDRIFQRNQYPCSENPSSPAAFAACQNCCDMIAALEPRLAANLGYLVEAGRDPAQIPFYWRSSRWVLLNRDGWLTELTGDPTRLAV